jgi:PncC family amidohydrolase
VLTDLSRRIIGILGSKGETLATAESCTGGGISAALTSVPGSSSVFWGGFVTYSNEAKMTLLDVDPVLIDRSGAVSAGVAKAMAWGARVRSGADWSVAVTGVAGPDGGSAEKPVGTVWIAWCDPSSGVSARLFHFKGDREAVRTEAAVEALKGILAVAEHGSD